MVPQFKENLFHLEGSRECLDENRGTDCVVGHADVGLGEHEDVVPETRFEVVFHFGEVEIGSESAFHELVSVVIEVYGKIEQRPRNRLVIDSNAGLIEMPSTGTKCNA